MFIVLADEDTLAQRGCHSLRVIQKCLFKGNTAVSRVRAELSDGESDKMNSTGLRNRISFQM